MSPFGRRRGTRRRGRLPGARRPTGRRPIIIEQDEDPAPASLSAGLGRRLGPKARFLGAALLIGVVITAGMLYFERRGGETAGSADPNNLAQIGHGASLYRQHCAECHGANLAGQPGWQGDYPAGDRPATPLNGTGLAWQRADDDLFDIVKYGGQPFSPPDYRNRMPAYERLLADGDIWAILAYVQSRWDADTWQRRRDLPPAS